MFSLPPPLGTTVSFEAVSGHDLGVDHRRGVVPGIGPGQGMAQGLPEIALAVALAHPFVNGHLEGAAHQVHVLAQLHEDHGQAAVLAHGHALLPGNAGVFQQLPEDLPAAFGFLCRRPPGQGPQEVFSRFIIGGNGRLLHCLGDFGHLDLPHSCS